jgi:DNA (cytosine-5)-methyltransferase 1
MTLDITATDLFCGAGGSSTGMVAAGVTVKMAANHWRLAIDTHQTNHPHTDHDLADLREVHPSQYPRTTIGWFSPECTNHSLAKGKKRKSINQLDLWGENKIDPAEERSRATMREVIEFTEYHRYEVVIVENVVDIRYWQHYEDWLTDMHNLGYRHKALYLNAQFFGVPQSRDRVYVVFWKKGNKAPDLDFRPAAMCSKHGMIAARQVFKKAGYEWGRYGDRRQYTYRCPKCGEQVQPAMTPAASVINWSLPTPLIGERKNPLKPKTLQRIRAGLEKFKDKAVMVSLAYMNSSDDGKVFDPDSPFPTQTTRQTLGLAMPPHVQTLRGPLTGDEADKPLTTIIASAAQHWLVMPPMVTSVNYFDDANRGVDQPLPTQTSANKQALVMPPFMLSYYNNATDGRATDEPAYTIAGRNTPGLVIPPFLMQYYTRDDAQSDLNTPMPTLTTNPRHALVIPPMIVPLRNSTEARDVSQPLNTVAANGLHHALIYSYNNKSLYSPLEPLTTFVTREQQALVITDEIVDACGFRMLTPEELKLGMSFPRDYIILGNNRDQVKQVGNAVCCNVAEWIVRRCVESLT